MYVEGNNQARSRIHCCSKNAMRITYYEYGSVSLVIQHTKRIAPYYIAICGLSGPIVFHLIS
jgi:hypothetical protein